ncbi:Arylsulfatase [Caulifigura coniformis]|uniref:Arylsulfatase n=1 Tax=Caulifigura coniformis TaxID=2527983 RepID=A0A517SGD1_9PLAN|nr:sulfatase-like hydrolase/transferase [Caulifigura coniformis]QDT55179.1 Arylsulfatase [Caulifigura coniformis]
MIRSIVIALLCVSLADATAFSAPPAKPNFIVILADDLGYECLGTDGGESYSTPHLDKLAAGGMRFDRAYAQPLCTPTRLQLMTGRYNVWNYTSFGELNRKETTFAQLLKPAGYATGIFGKWQLGQEVDSPQHFGFDVSCLWQQTRRPSRFPNPGLEFNGVERDFTNGEFGPDVVQAEALKFIDANRERPFFLYYPMILTHGPFIPTPSDPEYDPKAVNENAGQNKKFFASMVKHMDAHVGELERRLGQHGLLEKTLVLFIGDNGTGKGLTTRWRGRDYAGGKGLSTRAGMHVPFIASWPGVIPAGRVNNDLVDTTDVLPTLLDAAGVKPAEPSRLDGHSLLAMLQGQLGQPREWIYSWHPTASREFAAEKTLKLYADGRLVDYGRDPQQEHDITENTAETTAARERLQKVLSRFASARPAELKARDGKGYQDNMKAPPANRTSRKKAA